MKRTKSTYTSHNKPSSITIESGKQVVEILKTQPLWVL